MNHLIALFVLSVVALASAQQWTQATTTRYWDCSKPHCAWAPNWKNKGDQTSPFFNHNYAFQRCTNCPLGAKYFGTAAASSIILGGAGSHAACGKCYALRARGAKTASLIVQVNNWCPEGNAVCNGKRHFDIAVPGFDWNEASISNTCKQADKSILYYNGEQACMRSAVKSCNCARVSSDKRLVEGCRLFVELGWNNQAVDYAPVACPSIAPAKAEGEEEFFESSVEESFDETNMAVSESFEGEEFATEEQFDGEQMDQAVEEEFVFEQNDVAQANGEVSTMGSSTQESMPGWAVGVLVVASVACVVVLILAVVLVTKKI